MEQKKTELPKSKFHLLLEKSIKHEEILKKSSDLKNSYIQHVEPISESIANTINESQSIAQAKELNSIHLENQKINENNITNSLSTQKTITPKSLQDQQSEQGFTQFLKKRERDLITERIVISRYQRDELKKIAAAGGINLQNIVGNIIDVFIETNQVEIKKLKKQYFLG